MIAWTAGPAARRLACLAVAFGLAGCAYIGPSTVRGTRIDYNAAVQLTGQQELLLNLVRMRNDEPVFFMMVERISSEVSLSSSAGISAISFERGQGGPTSASADASVSFSETPTLYYVPLDGEVFSKRVMAPLDLPALLLMVEGDLRPEALLTATVRSINGLHNEPSDDAADAESYKRFQKLLGHAASLRRRGMGMIGVLPGEDPKLMLRLPAVSERDADGDAVRELLGLSKTRNVFPMVAGEAGRTVEPDRVFIRLRSIYSTMRFLSNGVDTVPGQPAPARAPLGDMRHGVLRVALSESEPDARLRVRHDSHWYYIANDDLLSRESFHLLALMVRLQAGNAGASASPMAISVGR